MNSVIRILLFYFVALSCVSASDKECICIDLASKADLFLNPPAFSHCYFIAECTLLETNETENSESYNKVIDSTSPLYTSQFYNPDIATVRRCICIDRSNLDNLTDQQPLYILYHSLKIPFSS